LNLDLSEFLLVNNLRKSCVNDSNNHLRDRKTQTFISYWNTISDKNQRPFHPKNNRKISWQKITFSEMSQIFFSPWKFSVALLQRFIFNFTFELGCIALMHQKNLSYILSKAFALPDFKAILKHFVDNHLLMKTLI